MRLVVDASVAVRLSLASGRFDLLAHHELYAPELLWSESLAALRQLGWRREISAELATHARTALLSAPVTSLGKRELLHRAWQVAEEAGWAKTYDAEYVATAELLGCPLVTADARLVRGASRFVQALSPVDVA